MPEARESGDDRQTPRAQASRPGTGLTGLYLTVCTIVNTFNVPVPAGTQPESSAP
jgi:hypothetical protein